MNVEPFMTGERLGRQRFVPPAEVIAWLAQATEREVEEFFKGYVQGIESSVNAKALDVVQQLLDLGRK